MDYNLTSSDRVHKYTINIPHELFGELIVKCKGAGFSELAPYLRALILREIRGGNFTIDDVLSKRAMDKIRWNEQLKSNSPSRDGFIKIGIKRIHNLFNPKQQVFNWKSPSVN